MTARLAALIAALGAKRPWLVLLIASALTVVSGAIASRIQVKTAFKDTMADDDPIVRRMSYLSDNFPGAVVVQVVLEGHSPERLVATARDLEARLKARPELIADVYLEADLDFFARRALVYLPEKELRLLQERLALHQDTLRTLTADPSLLGLLRGVAAVAEDAAPSGGTALTLRTRVFADVVAESLFAGRPAANLGLKVDPGPAASKLRQNVDAALKDIPLPPSNDEAKRTLVAVEEVLDLVADLLEQGDAMSQAEFGARAAAVMDLMPATSSSTIPPRYQFSKDKRLLLMEVGSPKNLANLEEIRPVLAFMDQELKQVRQAYPDVDIGLTGMPVQYVQEQEAILSNFVLVTILGLLGILAVFVVGFEQVVLPSLSAVPLVMGIVWTFGVQGIVDPELNMLNLLFPVVLFGLGVDYAIHLLNGFASRRGAGDDAETAIRTMLTEMLPSILTGSATTATAFFALLLAHMKGLKTLGFTAGVGVIMAVSAMIIVLPAIFVLVDRRTPVVGMDHGGGWLLKLGDAIERRRYGILAAAIVVICVAAYQAPSVTLERDALKMQPKGMPATVLQDKLLEAFGISGEPSIFFARDLAEAKMIVDKARQARTMSAPLAITLALPEKVDEKRPLIARIGETLQGAIVTEAPTTHRYDDAELEELRLRLAGVKRVLLEASAAAALLYHDDTVDLVGALRDDVNRIERRLANANVDRLQLLDTLLAQTVRDTTALVGEMTTHTDVTYDELPRSLRSRVEGKDGATMVLVRANGYIGDADFMESHVAELYGIHGEVAGIVPAWREMLNQILTDLPRLLGVISVAVLLLVGFGVRSLKGTGIALSPLLIGVTMLLGLLGATQTDLNFVSVLSLPLLLGTGIDYGVHLYDRIRHDGAIGPALAHAGKAILLSAMTTTIGFGSLMLSVHRGVFGLGLVTSVGIVCCVAITVLVMPALVAILQPEILRGPTTKTEMSNTTTSSDVPPPAPETAEATETTETAETAETIKENA